MRGFTLVEILVSILILGLLFAGVYGVLSVGSIIYRDDMSLLELQQQLRLAMQAMVRETRESKSSEVTLSDANARITFNIAPATYGDPWVGPISYYRDINDVNADGITDQVLREYPSGTWKVLANDITVLSFSITGDIVEIQVAAKKTIGARELCFPSPCADPQATLKETVKLRDEPE